MNLFKGIKNMLRSNLALMYRIFRKIAFLLGCLWALSVPQMVFPEDNTPIPQPPAAQVAQYQARVAKSILELQQFREASSIEIQDTTGRRGVATLINLHPRINTWFLLTFTWENGKGNGTYHLENRFPASQAIRLEPQYPYGIVLVSEGKPSSCQLWTGSSPSNLLQLPVSQQIYVPLCSERLYLRKKTEGHKTTKEWATDFLRTYVPGGEKITTIVKETFYQDAYLNTSEIILAEKIGVDAASPKPPGAPALPAINPAYTDRLLIPKDLGIELEDEVQDNMLVGRWYKVKHLPGVFVSAIEPKLVADEVIRTQEGKVNPLDAVESIALVYMVAFDLDQFQIDFAMGTEHPSVEWSERVPASVRNNGLPGPDGIETVAPLVNTGMVNPGNAEKITATFIGGFKRYHGAFRQGDLAFANSGTHYGFIENGVVMSKLEPGLATCIIYDDYTVELKTWTEQDNANLGKIRHARQNGLPLIEYDPTTGNSFPGAFVSRHGPGNWSGSVEGRYRTLRSGIGLQEQDGNRFLLYGYFSTATPSAMAQVFQAYHCKYALPLDMNALEHTYLAVYQKQDEQFLVQHLITGMDVLDRTSKDGQVAPRFVGYADNRDFFYLLRK
jgi:hypothetical protein